MAKKSMKVKQQRAPKFSTQSLYTLQSLRQTPLCTEKIWNLPYLLP